MSRWNVGHQLENKTMFVHEFWMLTLICLEIQSIHSNDWYLGVSEWYITCSINPQGLLLFEVWLLKRCDHDQYFKDKPHLHAMGAIANNLQYGSLIVVICPKMLWPNYDLDNLLWSRSPNNICDFNTKNLARIKCTQYNENCWNTIPCHPILVVVF